MRARVRGGAATGAGEKIQLDRPILIRLTGKSAPGYC